MLQALRPARTSDQVSVSGSLFAVRMLKCMMQEQHAATRSEGPSYLGRTMGEQNLLSAAVWYVPLVPAPGEPV
jgi:hypothetical protein